ncbi:DUF3068 domain-containing protein [Jiangella endophytica]|uniref:DUF3068 domain-containing protein n=1 Tax=Jiangella endophytica TaxID=1623398 RepID=UPI000E353E5E|nr:DUF3068 domain-containing protein [Jiangella endophytica]
MRRSIGLVLVGLGVLMLVLAPMSRWYAYPRLAVVSNDVAERVSTGSDVTVLDLGAVVRQEPEVERVTDVRSVRRIIPDRGDSTDDTAVWDTSVTNFDGLGAGATPEENVLSYFEERVAFDRHTGDSVDGHDQYYTPTGERADRVEVDHEGYYFKLPFGTEERSYPFWDSTIQEARPMQFQNETTLEGLSVYVFQQVIEPTPVSALEIPGALFGQAGSIVADRIYSNTRTIWVEPHTGAIIKGQEEQDSYLDFEGTRGPTIVQGTLTYTDDQVTANIDEFSSSADRLELVRDTVPIAAAAGGLVFVVLGLLLARRGAYHGKRRAPGLEDDGPDGPGGSGGSGAGAVAAAAPGVVTRPAEDRMPLRQRPRAQESVGQSRYQPAHDDRYDDGGHGGGDDRRYGERPRYEDAAAAAPAPAAEQPYADPPVEQQPRLHGETARGAGYGRWDDQAGEYGTAGQAAHAAPAHAGGWDEQADGYGTAGQADEYDTAGQAARADQIAPAGPPAAADDARWSESRGWDEQAGGYDTAGQDAYADQSAAEGHRDQFAPGVRPDQADEYGSAGEATQAGQLAQPGQPAPPQQTTGERQLDQRATQSLPRRRPQTGAVRPPVGRQQAQAQSAQSLLGQSPTGPLTPDHPQDFEPDRPQDRVPDQPQDRVPGRPQDDRSPARPAADGAAPVQSTDSRDAHPDQGESHDTRAHDARAHDSRSEDRRPATSSAAESAESVHLDRTRADLARLEQARAELARFAQEHPDLAPADQNAAESPSPHPAPAEPEPTHAATPSQTAGAPDDGATSRPATPAQGRRRARDDEGLFDEFDEDGQSAGSLHRY